MQVIQNQNQDSLRLLKTRRPQSDSLPVNEARLLREVSAAFTVVHGGFYRPRRQSA